MRFVGSRGKGAYGGHDLLSDLHLLIVEIGIFTDDARNRRPARRSGR